MRKIILLIALGILLTSCTSSEDSSVKKEKLTNIELPEDIRHTGFKHQSIFKIKASGITQGAEIWFEPLKGDSFVISPVFFNSNEILFRVPMYHGQGVIVYKNQGYQQELGIVRFNSTALAQNRKVKQITQSNGWVNDYFYDDRNYLITIKSAHNGFLVNVTNFQYTKGHQLYKIVDIRNAGLVNETTTITELKDIDIYNTLSSTYTRSNEPGELFETQTKLSVNHAGQGVNIINSIKTPPPSTVYMKCALSYSQSDSTLESMFIDKDYESILYDYQYDDNYNIIQSWEFSLLKLVRSFDPYDMISFGEHNVLKISSIKDGHVLNEVNYSYEYDSYGYPTSRVNLSNNEIWNISYTDLKMDY